MIWNKENLEKALRGSNSIADVIRSLGLPTNAGNYATFHRKVAEFQVDISNLNGQSYSGFKTSRDKKIPLSTMLTENSKYRSDTLRKRLIAENVKDHACENCNLKEWQGVPIPLELDHVSGDNTDNRLENLKLLCPNCHALTPTWRGRNSKKVYLCRCGARKFKTSLTCRDCMIYKMQDKIEWPSTQELLDRVKATSYTQVGKELGVSDNAVRKRIKNNPM